jgi:YD repeat-containing protein
MFGNYKPGIIMKKFFHICSCFLLTISFLSSITCGGDNKGNSANANYTDSLRDTNDPDRPGFPLEEQIKTDNTKMIYSFEFLAENNSKYLSADITGSIIGNTITLRVPPNTNRKSLIPSITYSGDYITPDNNKAVNFSKGKVTYTVIAEDGTSINYNIIIKNWQLLRIIDYIPKNNQIIDPDIDEIIAYTVPEFFPNGNWSKTTEYISNGKDGIWFNSDDDIDLITVYNKAGEIVESYSFNNPGPDGIYHTQDDVYNSYELHFYDKNGNEIEFIAGNSAGKDGIWLTEDDGFSALYAYEYENNLLTKEIQYSDTDVISSYSIFNYNQDSKIDIEWCYKGPGPDNNWFTEDDELSTETTYQYDEFGNISRKTVGHDKYDNVSYWYSYSYNSDNKIIESVEYNKAGNDNKWFTDDDVIKSREHYEYNKKGQITLSIVSNSPGTDGIWFNSDDNINSYVVYNYTKSTETQTCYYWPDNRIGPDGLWFTADDIPWYKTYVLYNTIKNVKKYQEIYITSYGSGNDGIWFTADDKKLNSYMRNRFDRQGNPIGTTYYNGAGNDGIWLTEDDLIDYYTVSVYK